MWSRSENLKAINSDWHEFRAKARRTAFSEKEFSQAERTQYDLDTAGITGADNPRTYSWDRPLNGVDGTPNNGTDVRELEDR